MRFEFCTLALFLIASRSLTAGAMDALEVKTFSCQPGDTLSVQNNYGRVRVRPWDSDEIEVRIRKITADESGLRNITVLPEKSGKKISLLISYHDSSAESVYIEVRAPRYLNLLISGTDLAVEIYGMEGHVRASTVTGLVTAEDLTSSASLLSDSGDIQYRSRVQPGRDICLESIGGDIRCRLIENLNLRSWIRAGGTLSWNQQIELNQGFLERQLGIEGPLLFASSTNGNVTIRLQEEKQPQPAHHPSNPSSSEAASSPQPEMAKAQSESAASTDSAKVSVPVSQSASGESSSSSGAADHGYRVQVNVDWIYLNVSVREHSTKRSIPHLKKDDFLIYEDDVLQTIEKFESAEAPFHLLLLLDVSGSTSEFL